MATIRKVSTVIGSELKAGQIVICNQTVEPILFRLILLHNFYKIVWMDSVGDIYQNKEVWHFVRSLTGDVWIIDL